LQKLLGTIKWVQPYLRITTQQLKNPFDLLKGDPDLTFLRQITPEARREMTTVCEHTEQFQADCWRVNVPVRLFVYSTAPHPSALTGQ
ncbi:POK8 protein, partial [Glaucidium brasilianum]|nr:POK8 protein [Glaucidium brasilianum]